MRANSTDQPASAFTTVEMLAVLFLAGLLAALTTLSLAGPLRSEQLRNVMNRVAFADGLLRDRARTSDRPARIGFDLMDGAVLDASASPARTMFRLPAGWQLDRLIVAGQEAAQEESNEVAISASGWSRSYAIRLTHGSQSYWIAVNGITGRLTQCDDEFKATDKINATGYDAD